MTRRLVISFSSGETSAFMTWWILNGPMRNEYDDIVVIFANSGEEGEESLEFAHRCDNYFGFPTVWVEAEVHHGERRANTSRVVNFETATRMNSVNGPFEQSIQKYGIPNATFKHCTEKLKLSPIRHYIQEVLGWGTDYDTAIGIRNDEVDRVSSYAEKYRLIYPLVSRIPTTKPQINSWWADKPFRLNLKGYEGNCAWCWKKTLRKQITLMRENPTLFAFPRRMEEKYGLVGPEFAKGKIGKNPIGADYKRTFFRKHMSVEDIAKESDRQGDDFTPATDDHIIYDDFDPELDVGGGCEESCEIYADEDIEQMMLREKIEMEDFL